MPSRPDSFSFIFKVTLAYFCVCWEEGTYATDPMWGSEDNWQGSAPSFYCVDCGGSNPGGLPWQQAPLPSESSLQPNGISLVPCVFLESHMNLSTPISLNHQCS